MITIRNNNNKKHCSSFSSDAQAQMPERYHGHDPRDRFKGSPTATINQIDGERILSLRTGPLIIAQCTEEEEEDPLFFVAVKQRGLGAQERRRGREYR